MRSRAEISRRLADVGAQLARERSALERHAAEEAPAALSFIEGELGGLRAAVGFDEPGLYRAATEDRALFRQALLNFSDMSDAAAEALVGYIADQVVDLDLIPEADSDAGMNYLYGRLAAFAWVAS